MAKRGKREKEKGAEKKEKGRNYGKKNATK